MIAGCLWLAVLLVAEDDVDDVACEHKQLNLCQLSSQVGTFQVVKNKAVFLPHAIRLNNQLINQSQSHTSNHVAARQSQGDCTRGSSESCQFGS
jgi:hypothetical protein